MPSDAPPSPPFVKSLVPHLLVVRSRLPQGVGVEDLVSDGEDRHVLDVWVVLNGVADDVVDVMTVLPPSKTGDRRRLGRKRESKEVSLCTGLEIVSL
jgi:hypothetical protein